MRIRLILAAAAALGVAACNGAATSQSLPPGDAGASGDAAPALIQPNGVDHTSVLKLLTKQAVVGSTVDPGNGDQNPYGLAYVSTKPLGGGVLKKGDLVICNFNDKANVQGNGTTIEYMSSAVGSTPKTFKQNSQLKGCASLVLNSFDSVYGAAALAKNVTALNPKGGITNTYKNSLLAEPWANAYIPSPLGYPPGDGVWAADPSSGKIIRINLAPQSGPPTYTAVISGFATNHGKPGSILGPSGMAYYGKTDTLYVVDGVTNTVVAFHKAFSDFNGANSVVVGSSGKTFTGPKAKDAKLIYAGSPLNGPISATLLHNGNLVIGNTLDNNMVEIATDGTLLDTKSVDSGAVGALFGIVSVGASDTTEKIYFNDDNANNVQVLEP